MGTIVANTNNLSFSRMAKISRGLTLARLGRTAEWHVRDGTYLSTLASITDADNASPLADCGVRASCNLSWTQLA